MPDRPPIREDQPAPTGGPVRPSFDPFSCSIGLLVDWVNSQGVAFRVEDDRRTLVGPAKGLHVEVRAAIVQRAEYIVHYLRPDLRPHGPIPTADAVDRHILATNPQIRDSVELHYARLNRRARLDLELEAAVMLIECQRAAEIYPYGRPQSADRDSEEVPV